MYHSSAISDKETPRKQTRHQHSTRETRRWAGALLVAGLCSSRFLTCSLGIRRVTSSLTVPTMALDKRTRRLALQSHYFESGQVRSICIVAKSLLGGRIPNRLTKSPPQFGSICFGREAFYCIRLSFKNLKRLRLGKLSLRFKFGVGFCCEFPGVSLTTSGNRFVKGMCACMYVFVAIGLSPQTLHPIMG